jgi:ketosteroid isomerase-like protein
VPRNKIDVVLANNRAFSSRDVEAMLALHAPDAVITDRREVGFGEFRGHDAIRAYYEGLFDNTASIKEDLKVASEQGDVVVASCHVRVQLADQPGNEGVVTFDYALRVEVRDGLIAALDIYDDATTAQGPS